MIPPSRLLLFHSWRPSLSLLPGSVRSESTCTESDCSFSFGLPKVAGTYHRQYQYSVWSTGPCPRIFKCRLHTTLYLVRVQYKYSVHSRSLGSSLLGSSRVQRDQKKRAISGPFRKIRSPLSESRAERASVDVGTGFQIGAAGPVWEASTRGVLSPLALRFGNLPGNPKREIAMVPLWKRFRSFQNRHPNSLQNGLNCPRPGPGRPQNTQVPESLVFHSEVGSTTRKLSRIPGDRLCCALQCIPWFAPRGCVFKRI